MKRTGWTVATWEVPAGPEAEIRYSIAKTARYDKRLRAQERQNAMSAAGFSTTGKPDTQTNKMWSLTAQMQTQTQTRHCADAENSGSEGRG